MSSVTTPASDSDLELKITRLVAEISAYDEEVALGASLINSFQEVTIEDKDECIRAKECIDLLNFVWPRANFATQKSEVSGESTKESPEPNTSKVSTTLEIPGYTILDLIGAGGMGMVYKAFQHSLKREVALKFLPPLLMNDDRRLKRFEREARAASSVNVAGILPVYDIFKVGKIPVLCMQYVDGMDLGKIITARRAILRGELKPGTPVHPWAMLPQEEYKAVILKAFEQLVEAVAALHTAKISHRDIKPSNILVDDCGNLWLSDFGLAKLAGEVTLTADGNQLGSRGYMSPEQWDGKSELDERVDVFGIGATIYQALTLKFPYGTGLLTTRIPRAKRPSRQSGASAGELDFVILKALEPDRDNRYQSAVELAKSWKSVRTGKGFGEHGPYVVVKKFVRRMIRRYWTISDLIVAACIVGVLLLVLRNAFPTTSTPITLTSKFLPNSAQVTTTETRNVFVTSTPAGARVVLVPLDPDTRFPIRERKIRPTGNRRTPVEFKEVPIGDYLVEVEVEGYGFHQVFRQVSSRGMGSTSENLAPGVVLEYPHLSWKDNANGSVVLPNITIPDPSILQGMAQLTGNPDFMLGDPVHRLGTRNVSVAPFALDTAEVTNDEFFKVFGTLPQHDPDDQVPTGGAFPVVDVTQDLAITYAERVGKRLPWEREYEFAVTLGGKLPLVKEEHLKPKPDQPKWYFGEARRPDHPDQRWDNPVIYGLYSNVAEWTLDIPVPYNLKDTTKLPKSFFERRVVRGGEGKTKMRKQVGPTDYTVSPRMRIGLPARSYYPGVGFRTARSLRPQYLDEIP